MAGRSFKHLQEPSFRGHGDYCNGIFRKLLADAGRHALESRRGGRGVVGGAAIKWQ